MRQFCHSQPGGVYAGIAVWTGSLVHFAVAVCVAPLLLLRTEVSQQRGLKWFKKLSWYLHKIADWGGVPESPFGFSLRDRRPVVQFTFGALLLLLHWSFGALIIVAVAVAGFCCRVLATIVTAATNPLLTISAIPHNWYRITFCLDTHRVPEILPGIEREWTPDFHVDLRFSNFGPGPPPRFNTERWSVLDTLGFLLERGVLVPTAVVLYVPPVLYRWSIKGTFLVYAPFVYIVSSACSTTLPLKARLEEVRDGSYFRLMRWLSGGVIVLFLAKLYLHVGWTELAGWWTAHVPHLVSVYVAPMEIPPWQLAALVNAVLAFVLLWFCEAALRRVEYGAWQEWWVERVLQVLSLVRGVLAIYTIVCTVAISVQEARLKDKVKLVWRMFPW